MMNSFGGEFLDETVLLFIHCWWHNHVKVTFHSWCNLMQALAGNTYTVQYIYHYNTIPGVLSLKGLGAIYPGPLIQGFLQVQGCVTLGSKDKMGFFEKFPDNAELCYELMIELRQMWLFTLGLTSRRCNPATSYIHAHILILFMYLQLFKDQFLWKYYFQ